METLCERCVRPERPTFVVQFVKMFFRKLCHDSVSDTRTSQASMRLHLHNVKEKNLELQTVM